MQLPGWMIRSWDEKLCSSEAKLIVCAIFFSMLGFVQTTEIPAAAPDTYGSVVDVCAQGLRIERKERGLADAAVIKIVPETQIFKREADKRTKVQFSDVQVGQRVNIWALLGSPIQLSFPVQLTAGFVLMEEATKPIGPGHPERSARQLPSRVFIEIQRSGGFAGAVETWWITEQTVVRSDAERKLSGSDSRRAQELAALLLQSCADSSFSPVAPCNDCYLYRVRIQSGDQIKTFHWYEVSPAVPELKELISLLGRPRDRAK